MFFSVEGTDIRWVGLLMKSLQADVFLIIRFDYPTALRSK